jgi:ribosomal protein S18 acetylase RimI-like enzyme
MLFVVRIDIGKSELIIRPIIRQTTINDLAKLKEIIDLSFPRFFRYFAWHSVSDLTKPVIVSETETVIAGFAKLIEFGIGSAKYGCILWIAIHPAYRHKGIALKLTNAGVEYLKQQRAKAVFASTQRQNRAALATLGKAGFNRVGFLGLWRLFGWRVFSFYRHIWYAPGEVVLMNDS